MMYGGETYEISLSHDKKYWYIYIYINTDIYMYDMYVK